MRYASFGSISHGTLRADDLLESFADELEYHVRCNTDCLSVQDVVRFGNLINEARAESAKFSSDEGDDDAEDFGDNAAEMVLELQDALQEFAPPYAYFGAHEGDGADFGFWLLSNAIDFSFDGLRVDHCSVAPR